MHPRFPWLAARLLAVVTLAGWAAGCDPTYCAKLHIEVRTAGGQVAPEGTEVIVSYREEWVGPPFPDTLLQPIRTVETDARGRTVPVAVCRFLDDMATAQVDALGGTVVVRGLPLGLGNVPDYPLRVVEGQRHEYELRHRIAR